MFRIAAVCLFVFPLTAVHARAARVSELPLPAVWRVKLDTDKVGVEQKWFAPDFNDRSWKPVSTHKSLGWDKQGLPEHVGFGWYRVKMFVPMGLAKKYAFLYFTAVDEEAWVWVNGKSAGEHTCAGTGLTVNEIWKTPFFLDVSKLIHYEKENQFTVRVGNAAKMGGVYKPVFLFTSTAPLTLTEMQKRANRLFDEIRTTRKPQVRYDVWTGYAYDPVFPETVPTGKARPVTGTSWARSFSDGIHLTAACRELVPFVVHVRNRGDEELQVRLDLADVRHETLRLILTADRVEPRFVDLFLTRAMNIVPDPLPRLGGANALYIPPGRTRSFFYLIDTTGMPAGLWKGEAHVTPMKIGPVLKLPFELRIAPVVLPRNMPIWVTMWEGNLNTRHAYLDPRGGDEPYLKLLRRTGCNVVMLHYYYSVPWPILDDNGNITAIDPVDFDRTLLRRRFGKDNFLVIWVMPSHRKRYLWWGKEMYSEQWNRNVVEYFRMLARYIRDKYQLPDDRWAIYLVDEHIGKSFLPLAKLVRQADPTIRIWANRVEDLETTKKAAPYIDIFVPHRGMIPRYRDSVKFMRDRGTEWWFYAHNGYLHDKTRMAYHRFNASSPHEIYRRDGWLAWKWNVRGMGYWIYGAYFQRYSGMGTELRNANPSFIYVGHDGPITTRRLEAYRDGLEDYKLLWIIDQAAKIKGQDPKTPAAARVDINKAVNEVLANRGKPEVLLRWRKTLLEGAAKLCNAAPLDVKITSVKPTRTGVRVGITASKAARVWAWVQHGGRYPSRKTRGYEFIQSPEPSTTPTVEITGLVPDEQCKVVLVVAGPQGQQKILRREIKAAGW